MIVKLKDSQPKYSIDTGDRIINLNVAKEISEKYRNGVPVNCAFLLGELAQQSDNNGMVDVNNIDVRYIKKSKRTIYKYLNILKEFNYIEEV